MQNQTVAEETQELARAYLTNPFTKHRVENAIAAHLLVHTGCRLAPEVALERALKMYEYFSGVPERIEVSRPTGKYASADTVVRVKLPVNDSGYGIALNLGIMPSDIKELPIRLTHGTKAERRQAWEAIDKLRRILSIRSAQELREEARRAREKRTGTIQS